MYYYSLDLDHLINVVKFILCKMPFPTNNPRDSIWGNPDLIWKQWASLLLTMLPKGWSYLELEYIAMLFALTVFSIILVTLCSLYFWNRESNTLWRYFFVITKRSWKSPSQSLITYFQFHWTFFQTGEIQCKLPPCKWLDMLVEHKH